VESTVTRHCERWAILGSVGRNSHTNTVLHGHCLEDNSAGDEIRTHADNISRMSVLHSGDALFGE
jgi:hypothetical protein